MGASLPSLKRHNLVPLFLYLLFMPKLATAKTYRAFILNCYTPNMTMPTSERRQIENEMIFRRANEKVGDQLDALDAALINEGHEDLIRTTDLELHLKCECSDENCDARIPIKLSVYQEIHENRDAFIIKPNHEVEKIEKVISSKEGYSVVLKNNSTAEPSNVLNDTVIDNT